MFSTLTTACSKCGKFFEHTEESTNSICLECMFPEPTKSNVQEVVITPALLDTSKLGESTEAQEYRPGCWSEYLGQESAKEKVQSYIQGCKKFNEVYPHTFISAPPGMGKTLFSTILANQLNKNIIFTTGGEIKSEQIFIDKLVECDGGVIYIDEANRLPKRVGFFILPLLEQFAIHGQPIKKFTAIFSTTHKGDISKDLDALLQRCDQINLEPYTDTELITIVEQYRKKQYPSIAVPDDVMNDIVASCRNTPRNAKNLLRAYAYNSNWIKIKKYNNIIKEGLTITDINILKYLTKCDGAGASTIANVIRVKSQTYLFEHEPYLIFKELIEVTNKRKITEKGKRFLNDIK